MAMTDKEFAERSAEDFKFMALCASKGNMAMYRLLADSEVEEERVRRSKPEAALPLTAEGVG